MSPPFPPGGNALGATSTRFLAATPRTVPEIGRRVRAHGVCAQGECLFPTSLEEGSMSPKSRLASRRFSHQDAPRIRPEVEFLERRDCPAAPTITNFAGQILSDNSVVLTGNVTDAGEKSVVLSISGAGSSSA